MLAVGRGLLAYKYKDVGEQAHTGTEKILVNAGESLSLPTSLLHGADILGLLHEVCGQAFDAQLTGALVSALKQDVYHTWSALVQGGVPGT